MAAFPPGLTSSRGMAASQRACWQDPFLVDPPRRMHDSCQVAPWPTPGIEPVTFRRLAGGGAGGGLLSTDGAGAPDGAESGGSPGAQGKTARPPRYYRARRAAFQNSPCLLLPLPRSPMAGRLPGGEVVLRG
jgi:hypothetical protein